MNIRLFITLQILLLTPIVTMAQNIEEEEKKKELQEFLLSKRYLADSVFRKIYLKDFTKLLLIAPASGNLNDYVSFNIDKPSASLNYVIKPKFKNKNLNFFNKSFLNLGVNGGYQSDLINVIGNQKPATNFNANISYSQIIRPIYFYEPSSKYILKNSFRLNYDSIYIAKSERDSLKIYQDQLSIVASKIKVIEELPETDEKLKTEKYNKLLIELGEYNLKQKKLSTLKSQIIKRDKLTDSLYSKSDYISKGLLWFTFNQQAGGIKFLSFDPTINTDGYKQKRSSLSYGSTLSFNYYYKSSFNSIISKLFNNSLLSFGGSLGFFNNFKELSPSELKESFKIENANRDSTYTKENTFTVYNYNDFKSFHTGKIWVEFFKMFDQKGTIGVRTKLLRDIPYSNFRNAQNNLETGIIFNSISKADSKSKISFEVFSSFFDLSAKNVKQNDAGQQFFKRNNIGIRTAIPFNF